MADDDVLQIQGGHQTFAPSPGGPGGGGFAGVILHLAADQPLGTGLETVLDDWTVELEDPAGVYYEPASPPSLPGLMGLTPGSVFYLPDAGYYRVSGYLRVTDDPGGGGAHLDIYTYAGQTVVLEYSRTWVAGQQAWSFVWEGQLDQPAFGYITARATNADKSALVSSWVAVEKLE